MKITVLLATILVVSYSSDEKPKDVTSSGSKLYVVYLVQAKSYALTSKVSGV
jgi:hypothetical protein